MIPFRFHPAAERELGDIVAYYEQERSGLGVEFLDGLAHAIDRARQLPGAGTRISGLSQRVEVRRYCLRASRTRSSRSHEITSS
jgi:plasmid stabilization system protein ParE